MVIGPERWPCTDLYHVIDRLGPEWNVNTKYPGRWTLERGNHVYIIVPNDKGGMDGALRYIIYRQNPKSGLEKVCKIRIRVKKGPLGALEGIVERIRGYIVITRWDKKKGCAIPNESGIEKVRRILESK